MENGKWSTHIKVHSILDEDNENKDVWTGIFF